jgi:DNA-binding NarL/FixJ family response regulator
MFYWKVKANANPFMRQTSPIKLKDNQHKGVYLYIDKYCTLIKQIAGTLRLIMFKIIISPKRLRGVSMTSVKTKHRILLVCCEEDYMESFQSIKASDSVHYEFLTEKAKDDYAATFDTLFVFSSDPAALIEEEEKREHVTDWKKKKIVFITPEKNMPDAMKILNLPVSGLISCEKFLIHAERAMETIAENPFLLSPDLNYKVVEKLTEEKKRQKPIDRFLVRKDKVDAPLRRSEMAILQLLLDGKSTLQIAEELFYSPKTVKRYVSNLISVMGEKDRTGVVVSAIRRGWVESEKV